VLIAAKPELDIFQATATEKSDKVFEILNRDSEAARQWPPDGFTTLHFAAFFNRPFDLHSAAAAHSGEIVRSLLE